MNINPAEERFLDYLEGRLNEAERGEFEKSLNESAELKRKLQEFIAISNLGDAVSKQEFKLGSDFTVRLMERIEEVQLESPVGLKPISIWIRRLTAPLAACATLAIALMLSIKGFEASRPEAVFPELAPQPSAVSGEAAAVRGKDKADAPANLAASTAPPKVGAGTEYSDLLSASNEAESASKAEAVKPATPSGQGAGQAAVADLVPPGHRGVTVKLEQQSGIEHFGGAPGSHVDVAVTYTDPADGKEKTRIAVEDAVVLSSGAVAKRASGGKAEPADGKKSSSETATLAMPPADSIKMQTMQEMGKISLIPRAVGDEKAAGNKVFAAEVHLTKKKVTNGRASNQSGLGRSRVQYKDKNGEMQDLEVTGNSRNEGDAKDNQDFGGFKPSPTVIDPQWGPSNYARQNDPTKEIWQNNFPAQSIAGSYIPATPTPRESGEVYAETEENQRVLVSEQPVSTFSLDVDTGSYTNSRRFLAMGTLPPKFAVRAEEFINYFDYSYQGEGIKPLEGSGPFAVYFEAAPSPLQTDRVLLKVGVKTKHLVQNDDLPWNLVFLVDTSGSMADEDKLPLLKRSLKLLVNRMRPLDRIGIVTYADTAQALLPSTAGSNKAEIERAIDSLNAGGGTNGADGIDTAYRQAEQSRVSGGVNRVILATDGDFNVGNYSFDGLMDLVGSKKKSGISLTTVGFGAGNYNEKNMEQLADRGDGNYFYVDSFNEARRIFSDELAKMIDVVAKDVKIQIEFNPEQVVAYRLIGYDNRRLKTEEFNNDGVDAGEVGGDQNVTVLYELALKGSAFAEKLKSELRYRSGDSGEASAVPAEVKNELGFLKIRYKEPAAAVSKLIEFPIQRQEVSGSVEQTSADFRFAAAVAYFAQVLRESQFAGGYKVADVIKLAEGAKGGDSSGKREEFIGLMKNVSELQRK